MANNHSDIERRRGVSLGHEFEGLSDDGTILQALFGKYAVRFKDCSPSEHF